MTFDLSIVDKNILKITSILLELDTDLYPHTYTINVIKYKPSTSDEEILDILISDHTKEFTESLHNITKDGHYIIDHLTVFDILYAKENKISGYCTDGEKFYKLFKGEHKLDINGNWVDCTIQEIIEVNHDSIQKETQETFVICYLHECYLELCDKKFKQLMRNRCNKKEDVEDFNLDLIGLSLSAIRYNLEFGYMNTAQSIVEDLNTCVNICKKETKNECGCCNQFKS